MVAHNAEAIFNEFRRLRDEPAPPTPDERLETYCREILTSVERLHFDYKTKRDSRTPQLEDDDKKNLAKAVSGFANSSGGVLLWGIKGNTVPTLTPIAQIQTFMTNLLELCGLATEPSVLGIDGDWIPSKNAPAAGFAAIFVPESSLPPHRVVLKLKDVQHHYYVRTGSDFIIATHPMLDDMFGRRPRPNLGVKVRRDFPYVSTLSQWSITFDVVNSGRAAAKDVSIRFVHQPWMKAEHGSSWIPIDGSYDAVTGQQNILLRLQAPSVIYPDMAMRFNNLAISSSSDEYTFGQFMQLLATIYCEGNAPTHISIEGTLEPRRST
jgi:hypothetical protein